MLFCAAMLQREAEREKGKILFNFQNINELNVAQHQRILRKNPDSSLNSHFIFGQLISLANVHWSLSCGLFAMLWSGLL